MSQRPSQAAKRKAVATANAGQGTGSIHPKAFAARKAATNPTATTQTGFIYAIHGADRTRPNECYPVEIAFPLGPPGLDTTTIPPDEVALLPDRGTRAGFYAD